MSIYMYVNDVSNPVYICICSPDSCSLTVKWKRNKREVHVTVEPLYNKVLGTMKMTLLYQVSHYIRVKKQKYKELGPGKLPCYKRVLLCQTSL